MGLGLGMSVELGVLQYGRAGWVGGQNEGASEEGGREGGGRGLVVGSFLSGDGLRYGSRWDHVQQVLSLPVC